MYINVYCTDSFNNILLFLFFILIFMFLYVINAFRYEKHKKKNEIKKEHSWKQSKGIFDDIFCLKFTYIHISSIYW